MDNSSDGTYAWTKAFGGPGADHMGKVKTDSNGNVYIVGYFSGSVNFNPDGSDIKTSNGGLDFFLTKYNAAGVYQWTVANGNLYDDAFLDLAIDSSGNVIVVGGLAYDASDVDIYITKFNPNGGFLWQKVIGSTGFDIARKVAVDADDNVYVTGDFMGSTTFASGTVRTSTGGQDVFLTKFSSGGTHQWTVTTGGNNGENDRPFGVAVDSDGKVSIVYYMIEDGNKLTCVDRFSTNAVHDGATCKVSTNMGDSPYGLAIDAANNRYIVGKHYNTANSSFDAYIDKISPSNSLVWQKSFGGSGDDQAWEIAVDSQNILYVVGRFAGTVNFDLAGGVDNRTANGSTDAFFIRLSNMVSGVVTANGSPLSGVTVTGSGALGSKTTDILGVYSFTGVPSGTSYTLTPSKTGYSFNPYTASGTLTGNATANFMAALNTYTISGTVTVGGSPLSGVTVKGSGSLGTKTTNSSGQYSFTGVPHGTSYTLTPARTGYSFNPYTASGTLTGNATANFMAALNTYTISGTVTVGGSPLSGVGLTVLRLTGSGTLGWSETTNSSGQFSFTEVPYGTTYALIPSNLVYYDFEPVTVSGTLTKNAVHNFTASLTDSDGDGISDLQEDLDGTDPLDAGSKLPVLERTVCSEWNGFLGMWNIMEHVNMSDSRIKGSSQIYSLGGEAGSVYNFNVNTGAQFDLLVHDMDLHTPNSYGKVCSSVNGGNPGDLDGRMVYYRPVDNGMGGYDYDFAFAMPFLNGIRGKQYVPYNTFQPSLAPQDADNIVANWIQVTNLEDKTSRGYLRFIDMAGVEIQSQRVSLAAGARQDLPGHGIVGSQKVGIIEWTPDDANSLVQLRNVRYYYSADGGFDSAFQLEGNVGSGRLLSVPLDASVGSSIVEVSNVLDRKVKVNVAIYDQQGKLLQEQTLSLKPYATQHIITDSVLSGGKGMATIQGDFAGAVVATVMQYSRTETQGIRNIYGIAAQEALGIRLRGSYNTFLNQGCRLRLVNPTSKQVTATIGLKRFDGTESSPQPVTIAAKGMEDFDLCSLEQPNVYGVVTVLPSYSNSIYATVVRIGQNDQYRFPTPVRQ